MNISIIIPNITLGAGTERAVTNLSNILVSEGYKVNIISILSLEGNYYELNKDITLTHLGLKQSKSYIKRIGFYLNLLFVLRKEIRVWQSHYLLGTVHAINCILPIIAFGTSIKTIACEHLSYFAAPKISRIFRHLFYPYLWKLVVLTNADKRHYRFMRNKVTVIPNSISFTVEKSSNLKNKKILSIGRLSYQKGFDMLIQATALLKPLAPDWQIYVIGEGELGEELKILAQRLHVDDYIQFYPNTKSIVNEFLNSSIYVMSSRWEGLPMVLIEAQSCGLPIVSFSCPEGPAEIIINDENGFLVDPDNVQKLAEKLHILIINEDMRMKMGRSAIVNSRKYSTSNICEKWNFIFKT
jgi:glycosyltransferase involved in cell wall biosynthesis